jgi:hypothetical protein
MKAVNDATKDVLAQFRKKAEEIPFDGHPYSTMLAARKAIGLQAWDDEHRQSAITGMAVWVTMIIGKSITGTLNEMVALMKIAGESGTEEHTKAANEMASSMTFVENVFRTFFTAIDFEYVAEQLFADGEKLEKERNEEFAAAEAAKAKVAKANPPAPPTPLSGTVHKRWEPSQN